MTSLRNRKFSTSSTMFFKRSIGKIDYAIISAMPEELDYIKNKLDISSSEKIKINEFEFIIYHYKDVRILMTSSGMGTVFAASLLTFIYANFNPEIVLFSGVAGGIDPKIKICDVVIAEQAFEAELRNASEVLKNTPFEGCLRHPLKNISFPSSYLCDSELLDAVKEIVFPDDLKVHYGNVVTSNKFPAPKELFEEIKESQALSIDMETSAFYQVAWLLNIPIIAIRGISNLLAYDGTDENVADSTLKGSAEAAGKVLITVLNALILKLNLQNNNNQYENEINDLVDQFKLQPHPEGGYYARIYESKINIQSFDSDRYQGETRKAGTAIYYLLRGTDFSAFHILKSDELWHYYKGSAIKIHVINNLGNLSSYLLGDPSQISGAAFQVNIPSGNWFAAEVVDKKSFCFVGCTVSPGFEFKDFELADRDSLISQFGQHANIIKRFTRCNLVDAARADNKAKLIKF
jgi:5'-methylthioadenosine/S-adenosylhomocysteine nucleosidase